MLGTSTMMRGKYTNLQKGVNVYKIHCHHLWIVKQYIRYQKLDFHFPQVNPQASEINKH